MSYAYMTGSQRAWGVSPVHSLAPLLTGWILYFQREMTGILDHLRKNYILLEELFPHSLMPENAPPPAPAGPALTITKPLPLGTVQVAVGTQVGPGAIISGMTTEQIAALLAASGS